MKIIKFKQRFLIKLRVINRKINSYKIQNKNKNNNNKKKKNNNN